MTSLSGIHKDVNFTLKREFVHHGIHVDRGEWQGLRDGRPQTTTVELYDISIDMDVPNSIVEWQEFCQPNLPWAEDHFEERISGLPLNPGEQYKNWPWYEGGVEEHKETGRFSHTYMERYWPGGAFGNLGDVIDLLRERPMTRQAYLTVWWPNDVLQSKAGERVPCSLGYLFQYNGVSKRLDCYYHMRSCDFLRYLWDDLYLTGRLLQWVGMRIDRPIGQIHAKIANLHIFQPEFRRIEDEYAKEVNERMSNAF